MTTPPAHTPVLLKETLEFLNVRTGLPGKQRIVDATCGLGGHGLAMFAKAGSAWEKIEYLGIDRDRQALEIAKQRLLPFGKQVHLAEERFSRFESILDELGWDFVDSVLADLGVSSLQLDDPERGFSFIHDGPLDMRMQAGGGEQPAWRLVANSSYDALKRIIRDYGEEPQAGRIARAIVGTREKNPIKTTLALAKLVEDAYPPKWRATARMHPATRTFMALRMAVNNELQELENFLERVVFRLRPGGRIVVISFHSLEDRLVKKFFKREARDCLCPPEQIQCACAHLANLTILTKKPVVPTEEEISQNSRARSAKLRAAQRCGGNEAKGSF